MATLLDALSDGSFDMQNKRDLSSGFARNLTALRDTVVNDYVKHKININKSIANLAKSKNLNDDQIQRIIEEVNNQVYLIEYSKLKDQPERHVTFDIAMLPKIKKIMDGSYEEPKQEEKKAFEGSHSFEKIASEENVGDSLNMFNSYSPFKCSLKIEGGEDESKVFLRKIANEIVSENEKIEKLGKLLDSELSTVGMAFVKYAQLGHNTNQIFTEVASKSNMNSMHKQLVKVATEKRLEDIKETSPIMSDFNVELNLEKNASEEFSLGKFSNNKLGRVATPSIVVDNKSIPNIDALIKIATSVCELSNDYKARVEKYDDALEKAAKLNITGNDIDKISNGFFKSELSVANTEKLASSTPSALSNATKALDSILAKNKKKLNINPIPSLDTKMAGNRFDYNQVLKKATPKKPGVTRKSFEGAKSVNGFNSFNLQ